MDSQSSTSITSLFSQGDITAIAWLVIAVVVIAFNGQLFSVAIGQRPIAKWFEFLPFGANGYTASAIVFICRISRAIASSFHALPNAVKPVSSVGARHTMFKACLAEFHVMRVLRFGVARLETSAIGRAAFSKIISENPSFFSALATAKPKGPMPSFVGSAGLMWADNSPMAEGLVS